jgi:hypothetical protein
MPSLLTRFFIRFYQFGFLLIVLAIPLQAEAIKLSQEQALSIGKKIWKNECDGTIEGLTSWNEGEEFASLGIGHFIWYVAGKEGPFDESYPKLVTFLEKEKVSLPEWIQNGSHCPWKTRSEFLKDIKSARMNELRNLLVKTIGLQARFAANRLEQALPKLLENVSAEKRSHIEKQFYRVAESGSIGIYALMDYVNFKGEGILLTERYNGEGWGLLQVLERMKGTEPGRTARNEFADSAVAALALRVKNSPPARHEERWTPGWNNRIDSYRE